MTPVKRDRLTLGALGLSFLAETDSLTLLSVTEEQDAVLERSAMVNGLRLSRWRTQDELEVPETAFVRFFPYSTFPNSPFPRRSRPSQPPLSPAQLNASATWVSARQAFTSVEMYSKDARSSDIVQDNVSDCSVVAALIVAAEHHSRYNSKVRTLCCVCQSFTTLTAFLFTARPQLTLPATFGGLPQVQQCGPLQRPFAVQWSLEEGESSHLSCVLLSLTSPADSFVLSLSIFLRAQLTLSRRPQPSTTRFRSPRTARRCAPRHRTILSSGRRYSRRLFVFFSSSSFVSLTLSSHSTCV
jgi:hypothetical protein